jgi:hypothetical protein
VFTYKGEKTTSLEQRTAAISLKGSIVKMVKTKNKLILGNEPRRIAINPKFDKLITSLRAAVDNDGTLDKESTSYNDIFDAFRLALKFYRFQEKYD